MKYPGFYRYNNILIVKHIYNYNMELSVRKSVNIMTSDAFDKIFSTFYDIHQRDVQLVN